MANKRKIYEITHSNFRINDKNMQGTKLVLIGDSTWDGKRPSKGAPISKNDITHKLFKFEDVKLTKELGLPKTYTITLSSKNLSTYITETNKDEING